MINSFSGEYFFLSNFYPCTIHFNGFDFHSAEAAFQASKCKTLSEQKKFTNYSPKDAKYWGKQVELRPDWEEVKVKMMKRIISAKFHQNDELAQKLVATGDQNLIEGNTWNDTFWGMCNGVGENHLGRILMDIRDHYAF